MIGFLSSFMLSRVRQKFEVKTLWYGALEMTEEGVTPVLKLDGLDRVRQWLEALNRFDATGNYRVFGSLLTKDGVASNLTKHLEKAAFYERTLNLPKAVNEINHFKRVLRPDLKGASGLFKEKLAERLKWVNLDKLSKQQAQLARQYWQRRDYVRAALFGWESLVSQECEKSKLDPKSYADREGQNRHKIVENFALRDGQNREEVKDACKQLNQIPNALAHGTRRKISDDVKRMLQDESKLHDGLKKAFDYLLPTCLI